MLCPDLPYAVMQSATEPQIERVRHGNAWGAERQRWRSTYAEGEGCFGKKNLISDEAFSPESKYYLRVSNPIPSILGIELLILHGSRNTVHSG
ncbi:hypothetical protein D8674_006734 [Pyrus ussuriensis x Pyrus communis]|uniref:Uncharacterized protein n=1 Tax=Pyrus ussuriensis x Pyrus communis TaxID=2448454 RepID=A0A5N5FVT4_9ROSA|nr:hypothetical protein D8674_006734 [Pyrus ussuriensis x Pyrus communis]